MMHLKQLLVPALSVLLGLTALPALAQQQETLTFGGNERNGVDILNYFNGGNDSYTNDGTGPSDGVVFSGNGESLKSTAAGGTGKFENDPSGANGVLYFAYSASTAPYLNVAGGFTSFSFDYSLLNNTASYAGNVEIWSGQNGTGTLLDTVALGAAGAPTACTASKDEFCSWQAASAQFAGTAESVTFGTNSTAPYTEFDNLQLTATPLPPALPMLLAGVGLLAAVGLRRRTV